MLRILYDTDSPYFGKKSSRFECTFEDLVEVLKKNNKEQDNSQQDWQWDEDGIGCSRCPTKNYKYFETEDDMFNFAKEHLKENYKCWFEDTSEGIRYWIYDDENKDSEFELNLFFKDNNNGNK